MNNTTEYTVDKTAEYTNGYTINNKIDSRASELFKNVISQTTSSLDLLKDFEYLIVNAEKEVKLLKDSVALRDLKIDRLEKEIANLKLKLNPKFGTKNFL